MKDWNSKDCIPRILNCGHNYCSDCLLSLWSKENVLTCSICLRTYEM